MSATGVMTDAMKNILANAYAGGGLYVTLLKGLTLASPTSAGASTFTVDLSVAAGDKIVFDQGQTSQEECIVGSVSGSGPYVVTPVNVLTNAHVLTGTNAGIQSHCPLASATVHEVTVTRSAATWGSPSPAGTVTTAAAAITVPALAKVGSMALYSASTSGTYYDATAVAGQNFPTSQPYVPVWIEVVA